MRYQPLTNDEREKYLDILEQANLVVKVENKYEASVLFYKSLSLVHTSDLEEGIVEALMSFPNSFIGPEHVPRMAKCILEVIVR